MQQTHTHTHTHTHKHTHTHSLYSQFWTAKQLSSCSCTDGGQAVNITCLCRNWWWQMHSRQPTTSLGHGRAQLAVSRSHQHLPHWDEAPRNIYSRTSLNDPCRNGLPASDGYSPLNVHTRSFLLVSAFTENSISLCSIKKYISTFGWSLQV